MGFHDLTGIAASHSSEDIRKYYVAWSLVTPSNDTVRNVNSAVTQILQGEGIASSSIDNLTDDYEEPIPPETINSFTIPLFSDHKTVFKVGMPFMLLRNLKFNSGPCDGKCLVVQGNGGGRLKCQIISGPDLGWEVVMLS